MHLRVLGGTGQKSPRRVRYNSSEIFIAIPLDGGRRRGRTSHHANDVGAGLAQPHGPVVLYGSYSVQLDKRNPLENSANVQSRCALQSGAGTHALVLPDVDVHPRSIPVCDVLLCDLNPLRQLDLNLRFPHAIRFPYLPRERICDFARPPYSTPNSTSLLRIPDTAAPASCHRQHGHRHQASRANTTRRRPRSNFAQFHFQERISYLVRRKQTYKCKPTPPWTSPRPWARPKPPRRPTRTRTTSTGPSIPRRWSAAPKP